MVSSFGLAPILLICLPWLALRGVVRERAQGVGNALLWSARRWGRAMWLSICFGLAILGLFVAGAIPTAIAFGINPTASVFVGLAALAVIFVIGSRWLTAVHALVLEDERGFAALGRSWQLSSEHRARLLGFTCLYAVVGFLAVMIPFGLELAIAGDGRGPDLVRACVQAVFAASLAPFSAGVLAVLYADLFERAGGGGADRFDHLLYRAEH